MDNAVYVGLSRQMVLRRELDLIANNVANANTVGFKVESLLARTEPGAPASNDGAPRPVKFVLDGGVARDFTQGGLFSTGSDLDVGIEGDGFFEVATDEGPRYTRDGRFTLDELGRITTQAGDPVAGEGGGEIIINPENGAVTIGPDGAISQGENLLGRIAVMRSRLTTTWLAGVSGVPPRTSPVLPPCGTIVSPSERMARTARETSSVVRGRTTATAPVVISPCQSRQ